MELRNFSLLSGLEIFAVESWKDAFRVVLSAVGRLQ